MAHVIPLEFLTAPNAPHNTHRVGRPVQTDTWPHGLVVTFLLHFC